MTVFLSEQTAGVAQESTNFVVNQVTANFTVAAATAPLNRKAIYNMINAGATTATIPLNATVAYPIGYEIILVQGATGTCTVTATGGVTLVIAGAAAVGPGTSRRLVKTAVDSWLIV